MDFYKIASDKDIFEVSKRHAFYDFNRRLHMQAYQEGIYDLPDLTKELHDMLKFNKENKKVQYYMVTINWRPGSCVQDVTRVVQKLLSKKWVKWVGYTYQWGENKTNFHTHMIILNTKAKSQIVREFYNTCKNDVTSQDCIDVKPKGKDYLDDGLKYIKHVKDFDDEMREHYRLEGYYINDELDLSDDDL